MKNKNGFDFVLDCSVTLTWLFEDECTPQTDKILQELGDSQSAVVPSIWPLEVANVLLLSKRKKRISHLQSTGFVEALSILPIHVDETTMSRALHSIYSLAEQEALTIYDAAYLELAVRENIPLATQDRELAHAAKRLKVELLCQ